MGITPFLYFPDKYPDANGEYASKPTFSLIEISERLTSKPLFKKLYAFCIETILASFFCSANFKY